MKTDTTPNPSDYLACRERFLIAMHKHKNYEQELFELFDVSNSSELDRAILEARSKGQYWSQISQYHQLGRQLDLASDLLDLATELQRRRVAQNAKQMDESIKRLEC